MKKLFIWILAIAVTLATVVFQRLTGPTKPYKETVTLHEISYNLRLPGSLEIGKNSGIELPIFDKTVAGLVSYRIYKSDNEFITDTMKPSEKGLTAYLPEQQAAGKLEYKLRLTDGNSVYTSPTQVVRYKNPVPVVWLIPHIVLMFIAMLFASAAGLMAAFNVGRYAKILFWCGISLFLGGFVFGMIVQQFAFGEFWAGVPLGWDLTDNKTLIAMLIIGFAMFKNHRRPSRKWTIIAALALLLVYSIPHSTMGSERNPETGEITHNL